MAKMSMQGVTFEGTPEELREIVRTFEEGEAEAKTVKTFEDFANGDKVRLLSGGGEYPLLGFKVGEELVISKLRFSHAKGTMIEVKKSDGEPGYALPEQLELVAKEASQEPLKVGDKVEVIDGSNSRWGDLGTGTIGEITDIDEDYTEPYRVDTEDDYDRFPADVLRKVEEKPREYRYGDIVKGYGIHVDHEVIGIVRDVGTTMLGVNFNGNRYTAIEDFELIAPVESRVDTK